ncbi:MAG: T9SS type A sorting domain-containing protein [Flavobacteriales bacterium]|nr:T9SS type A sorting domain-containing protein [Flavobacteriales bacterium]
MKAMTHYFAALSMAMAPSLAQATQWEHYSEFNSGLPSNATTTLETSDSGVWVGTGSGLAHYDGTTWMSFTTENSGIPSDQINDIHVDAEGAVWVATYEGLGVYRDRVWEVFNTENSMLPSNLVRCLTSDHEGNLWIGTWGGGLVSFGTTGWASYTSENSALPSNGIYDVAVDIDNRIWMGTYSGGAAVLEAGSVTVFDTQNSGLPQNNVRSVAIDDDGAIWLGTENGLARLAFDGEVEWQVFTDLYFGYSVHAFRDIVKGADGILWFATDAGLFTFQGGSFQILHTSNSDIAANSCVAVAADPQGNVFVAHPNHGVSAYNPNGVTLDIKPGKLQLNMEVFPNPTTDVLTVKIPLKGDSQYGLMVMDLTGRTVISGTTVSAPDGQTVQQTLDVSGLPVGTYLLTVRSANDIASAPFVKR